MKIHSHKIKFVKSENFYPYRIDFYYWFISTYITLIFIINLGYRG